MFSCFTSSKPAALLVLAVMAALFAVSSARAEQITEKLLSFPTLEHVSGGKAQLQMRAGYAAGSDTNIGALLQPRMDFHSGTYGRFFAAGTSTSGLSRSATAPSAIALEDGTLVNLKQLYGGWSSGRLFGGLGEDALTLSFGHETIEDGRGTLTWAEERESCDAACWLGRTTTGTRSLSARLKTGSVQGQTFYLQSRAPEGSPAVAGMSATLNGSALGLGAGVAGLVREDPLAIERGSIFSRLEGSYRFSEVLPWSPTLTSGYGVVWGKAEESSSIPVIPVHVGGEAGEPLEYIRGNGVAQIGFSAHPVETLKLQAAYETLVCDRRAQGVKLAAEWRASQRLSFQMLGGLSDTGTQFSAPSSTRDTEAGLSATVKLGF